MSDFNFVVKNSLTVNSLFVANSTQISIGSINSTSNGVYINTTAVIVGNSTVNLTLNSTSSGGIANNASYLGGTAAANYVANSGNYSIGGAITFVSGANLVFSSGAKLLDSTGSQGSIGQVLISNGSSNVYWGGVSSLSSVNQASQYTWTNTQTFANTITFGNSTVNTALGQGNSTANYISVANSSQNTQIFPTLINVGNSTVYTQINVSSVNTGILYVTNVVSYGFIYANNSIGSTGQVLLSAGPGGNTYWGTVPASSSAAGANTQVQFDDSGSLAGATGFTWNKTTNTLTVSNTLVVSGNVSVNTNIFTMSDGSGNNAYCNSSAISCGNTTSYFFVQGSTTSSGPYMIIADPNGYGAINSTFIAITGGNSIETASYSNTAGANGYTVLTNSIWYQYGVATANSSTGTITFPVSFGQNAVSIVLTAIGNYSAYISSFNKTSATIRTTNSGVATNVHFVATGF